MNRFTRIVVPRSSRIVLGRIPRYDFRLLSTKAQESTFTDQSASALATQYKSIVTNPYQDEAEIFIYNLLQSNNMPAVTTLLHTILNKSNVNTPHYRGRFRLSNQLWSLYSTKVCENANYGGACLVYHELIDPAEPVSNNVPPNELPFLLSTELLQYLSLIFVSNADSIKVQGVLKYFKRFYSSIGHRELYKSLRISLVEVYSLEGNLERALQEFEKLYYIFSQHTGSFQPRQSMEAVFQNYRLRRLTVRKNLYEVGEPSETAFDLKEEEIAKHSMKNAKLFKPNQERNIYTLPSKRYYSFIQGGLSRSDLPNFHNLINANVTSLLKGEDAETSLTPEKFDTLLSFINSSQPSLQIFVFKSLCDMGYIKQAWYMLFKLNDGNGNVEADDYLTFFGALDDNTHNLSSDQIYKMCFDLMNLQKISIIQKKSGNRYLDIIGKYINVLLTRCQNNPNLESAIGPYLDSCNRNEKGIIILDKIAYGVFRALFREKYPFVRVSSSNSL
ncbi:hypothetical protein CLIB1423_01S00826 [[Candida] railenensis]|uniref:Uncharacterized protein n=1 Tax=[Candida] railenensis TaxID=45579 RepID=A0A9P0QJY8_9ASCO|nr:hypothetical protein CLIB1423_01S00826 [[Candida] railenensis]